MALRLSGILLETAELSIYWRVINVYSLPWLIQQQTMGNSTAKPSDYAIVRSYRPEDWAKEHSNGDEQIWRNKQTQEKVQVYSLQETPSMADMTRYELRTSEQHLVKVYHIAVNNSQMFCVASQFAQLLVQHIPIRLSEVAALDIEEGLTVLHSALKGFHCIDTLFGHVKTSEELVGFNCQGKPKVWLNKQFNINFCEHEFKKDYYSQQQQVKTLFRMVDRRVKGKTFSDYVRRELLEKNLNFLEAAELIQQYAFREELSLRRNVRIDILERQLGLSSKLGRINSVGSLLSDRLGAEEKSNQLTRVESCRNLLPASPQMTFHQKQRSIEQRSQVRVSLCTSPKPKITFNQNARAGPHIVVNNMPALNMVKKGPKLELKMNSNPLPVKLQKMSVNHYCFKIPQSLTRNNSFVPGHKMQGKVNVNLKKQEKLSSPVDPLQIQRKQEPPQVDLQETNHEEEIVDNQINANMKDPKAATVELLSDAMEKLQQLLVKQEKEAPTPSKETVLSEQSIIDKMKELDQENRKETANEPQETVILETVQYQPNKEQVGVSGVFNQPDNYHKNEQMDLPPMIVEEPMEEEMKTVTFNSKFTEEKSGKKEIPINFQSFGASMMSSLENISFAPKTKEDHISKQEVSAQTSKSVNIEEEEEVSSATSNSFTKKKSGIKLVESGEEKCEVQASENQKEQYRNGQYYGQYSDLGSEESKEEQLCEEKMQGISPLNINQGHPLYQECTSVQSKFHIVRLKDYSNVEQSSNDHSNRISAFAQVEEQDLIKNQFNTMFQKEGIRMNRVASEYQMLSLKKESSEPSHSQHYLRKRPLQVKSNIHLKEEADQEDDFLDVQFLEKSLDLKLRSMKKKPEVKEEEELNISKLDQKLEKFSASKISENCSPANKVSSKQPEGSSNITMNSEKEQNSKFPSTLHQPSIFSRNQKLNSAKDVKTNPKIQYYESIVTQCRWKEGESTGLGTGFKTTDEEKFSSIFKEHRSLGKKSNDLNHMSDNEGEKWRKNTEKRQSYTSLSKQSNALLEERYRKYVKQPRQSKSPFYQSQRERDWASIDKGRNYQRLSDKVSPFKIERESTISYDHLSSILRN